jgi:hypothetical protein
MCTQDRRLGPGRPDNVDLLWHHSPTAMSAMLGECPLVRSWRPETVVSYAFGVDRCKSLAAGFIRFFDDC